MPEVLENCLSKSEVEALVLEVARSGESLGANVAHNVADAMRAVGVRPVMVYAYVRTGLLVAERTRDVHATEELRAWHQAVHEYFGTFRE